MTEQKYKPNKLNKRKLTQMSLIPKLSEAKQQEPQQPASAPDSVTDKAVEAKLSNVPEEYTTDPLLLKILSTRRSHGSEGDKAFRLWLFNYLNSTLKAKPQIKIEGNIYVETDAKSTVLFSCHVDTVHRSDENGIQQLAFDPAFGHLFLADKKTSSCLGGDDGVGVYIMLKMIEAGVKGRYMFHTGEERSGIGSNAFVRANKQFCEQLEVVVAFDRAVRSQENPEVILTQGGKRCASDEFGKALCEQLNRHGNFDFPYVISHKGSFTDSKVYADDVPECVNVACFYERQHTCEEYVDVVGVDKLVAAACKVEWHMLPIVRDNRVSAKIPTYSGNGFGGFHGGMSRDFDDDYHEFAGFKNGKPASFGKPKSNKISQIKIPPVMATDAESSLAKMSREEIEAMAYDDPDSTLQALLELIVKCASLTAENNSLRVLAGIP
jgi:hypothetical protein